MSCPCFRKWVSPRGLRTLEITCKIFCYPGRGFLALSGFSKGCLISATSLSPPPQNGHTEMIAVNRKLDDSRKHYSSAFSPPVLQKLLVSGVRVHRAFMGRVSERGWQESHVLQRRSQRAVFPCHLDCIWMFPVLFTFLLSPVISYPALTAGLSCSEQAG